MQIIGKIRLKQMPWINHSWHVTFYPTARGLTTLEMRHGERTFQIDFDFLAHELQIAASDGRKATLELRARSVADFYRELMQRLTALDLPVRIYKRPNELPDTTPFDEDETNRTYHAEHAARWWQVTAQTACVLQEFRARYIGKSSPVHFFWGSFDLAVTRFSGRRAPPHPGKVPHLPDWVVREAYSHEVSSLGFWPGGDATPFPMFYSYAYPEPDGFAGAHVRPSGATYHDGLSEFVLPYEEARRFVSPDAALLEFAESTYTAAAEFGRWDRASLEREPPARSAAGTQPP
jgi:hypothetical protein